VQLILGVHAHKAVKAPEIIACPQCNQHRPVLCFQNGRVHYFDKTHIASRYSIRYLIDALNARRFFGNGIKWMQVD
jgi:hypothetical protein